jgi:CheY-like chemotaxis protein
MDGFEALASIRDQERQREGTTPIVALTAHAMKGDKEHCLNAGFNGYLSKPIHAAELYAAIEAIKNVQAPKIDLAARTDIDLTFALDQAGGDPQLLHELIELFLDCAPGQLDQVRDALERGDARHANQATHTLRGSVSQFLDAEQMTPLLELESMTKAGRLEEAKDQLRSVADLLDGLLLSMTEHLPERIDTRLAYPLI